METPKKLKWQGGHNGKLPYVDVGDICYIIRDIKVDDKWKYRLYMKKKPYTHKLHMPKNYDLLKWFTYGTRVFERWWKLKHRYPPFKSNIHCDYKTTIYEDKHGRFMYCVTDEEIKIIDTGVPLGWLYNTMAEAKKNAEPIILKAIKEYEKENQQQFKINECWGD